MDLTKDLQKLSAFIEENTRASSNSGIAYIDPLNFKNRILLKQNHIIFGRRGAGKSSLIKTLKESQSKDYLYSYVNLEDLKDVTFPNILIQVLDKLHIDLIQQTKKNISIFNVSKRIKFFRQIKTLRKAINNFKKDLDNPDLFDETITTQSASKKEKKGAIKSKTLDIKGGKETSQSNESMKTIRRSKLDSIKNAIPNLKDSLSKISSLIAPKPFFIIFDDFYFLKKIDQVLFIDFFHRLAKDTFLFLKIATIKHRSKIYSKIDGSHFGTEIGHDIHEINLDYNLNRFNELKDFMRSLIQGCSIACNIKLDLNLIFSEGAFAQLCLASGGVPRDFLTLFVRATGIINRNEGKKISKKEITEAAIQNMANKSEYLRKDSVEEKEALETYLNYIKDKIIKEKKTNMFLVSNNDITPYPQINQAIKELVDMRMLHLVEPDTSAAGGTSGQRYSAYIVDVGLYPSALQMGFKQLDPGVTDNSGRKDEMRGAPKINLQDYQAFIESKHVLTELGITDYD